MTRTKAPSAEEMKQLKKEQHALGRRYVPYVLLCGAYNTGVFLQRDADGNETEHYRCPKCKTVKSASEFGMRNMHQDDGVYRNQPRCSPCRTR